jgi:hypothetical protein
MAPSTSAGGKTTKCDPALAEPNIELEDVFGRFLEQVINDSLKPVLRTKELDHGDGSFE